MAQVKDIVSIIDGHTRECLLDSVERSIIGHDLTAELDNVTARLGTYPAPGCARTAEHCRSG